MRKYREGYVLCSVRDRATKASKRILLTAALWSGLAGCALAASTPTGILTPTPPNTIALNQVFVVTFDGPMKKDTVEIAITLTKVRDSDGLPVNVVLARTVTPDFPGKVYTVVPNAALDSNSGYLLCVSTDAQRTDRIPLPAPLTGDYSTSAAGTPMGILSPAPLSTITLNQVFVVTFDAPMQPTTVGAAVALTKIRDDNGLPVSESVSRTITPDAPGKVYTVVPNSSLAGNSGYRLSVSQAALGTNGNPLAIALTGEYSTVMDPGRPNVFQTPAGVRLVLPIGSLPPDVALQAAAPAADRVESATSKLLAAYSDGRLRLVGDAVNFALVDLGGMEEPAVFAVPLTISFPFSADVNGRISGSNPPIRASTLRIYWLDEVHDAWVRLPSSRVDLQAGRVSAEVPHFTTFAAIGDSSTDLTGAFAFPVPVSRSAPGAKITFMQLGDDTRIRLFTVGGEEVASLHETDSDGLHDWDLRNASGQRVAPGVYHYVLQSGSEVKRGKVVILP